MAIVGTAYVRLRVIGDKLKGDIAKATQNAVDQSAPNLSHSGEKIGEKISDGVGDSMERSVKGSMARVADDIGEQIGRRMAENMGKSLRRRAGDAFTNGMSSIRSRVSAIGDRVAPEWKKISDKWGKLTGKNFAEKLKGALVGGIALLITALPSIIAFAGAVAGALVATLVPAIGLLGTVAAGAGLAVVGAFATMKISAGLFSLAMKAPSAALDDFKKRTEAFKGSIAAPIQAGLFSGFNAAMRISAPIIAGLTPMLREFGNNVGDIAINFADAFRQGAMLERLQRILTVNNDAVRLGGAGAVALGQAFAVLLDHLSPIILYLASGVRDLSNWALTSILAAEGTGQLDNFITSMFTNLTRFVGILVDFGVGIFNVFLAASRESMGMMTSLEGIAARFRAWTGDPANQDRMIVFFENMRIITGRVLQIFGQLGRASGKALEGTNVESVLQGLTSLARVGADLGRMFEQIRKAAGPQLMVAFQAFVNMLTNLADSGVLGTLSSAFANLFNIISTLLNIPGVAPLLALVGGLAAMFTTVKFLLVILRPLQIVFTVLRVVLVALAGVFGWLPVLIGLLVAALIWFFTQTKIGQAIVAAVWNFIKNAISTAVDAIIVAWDWMVSAFQAAVAWVVQLAQTIWSGVSTAFVATRDAVVTAFTAVRDFIVGVWTAIWGFLQPIIQGIWSFISTVFGAIVSVIQGYLNILYQIWIRVWPLLALPIRILYGLIMVIWNLIYAGVSFVINQLVTFVVWAWNGMVAGVSTALNAAWTFIQFIWNAIWGFIQPIVAAIWNYIVGAWNAVSRAINTALSAIWGFISSIWNAIWGFISSVVGAIVNFVVGRWNNLVNNVRGAMNAISGVISTVWGAITSTIRNVMGVIGGLVGGGWDMIKGAGTAVLNGLKAAVNTVIGAVNTVISGINWAINTANKLPGPDIPKIPDIPKLARGGVVSPDGGGTLAMIAEAGRKERIEPLDPSGLSVRDRALIKTLAGSSGGTNVTVLLGTREIEDIIDVVVEDRDSGLADRVLTGTKG